MSSWFSLSDSYNPQHTIDPRVLLGGSPQVDYLEHQPESTGFLDNFDFSSNDIDFLTEIAQSTGFNASESTMADLESAFGSPALKTTGHENQHYDLAPLVPTGVDNSAGTADTGRPNISAVQGTSIGLGPAPSTENFDFMSLIRSPDTVDPTTAPTMAELEAVFGSPALGTTAHDIQRFDFPPPVPADGPHRSSPKEAGCRTTSAVHSISTVRDAVPSTDNPDIVSVIRSPATLNSNPSHGRQAVVSANTASPNVKSSIEPQYMNSVIANVPDAVSLSGIRWFNEMAETLGFVTPPSAEAALPDARLASTTMVLTIHFNPQFRGFRPAKANDISTSGHPNLDKVTVSTVSGQSDNTTPADHYLDRISSSSVDLLDRIELDTRGRTITVRIPIDVVLGRSCPEREFNDAYKIPDIKVNFIGYIPNLPILVPIGPNVECFYRCLRCQWYFSRDSKPGSVYLSATEYAIGTGVVIPYVFLLNMRDCLIMRHEVTVPVKDEEDVRFVVYTGEHKTMNKAIQTIDSTLKFYGELVIFRVAQDKHWSTVINLRGGDDEECLLDHVARKIAAGRVASAARAAFILGTTV